MGGARLILELEAEGQGPGSVPAGLSAEGGGDVSGADATDIVGKHLVPVEGVVLKQCAEAGGDQGGHGAENASEPGVSITKGDEGAGLIFVSSDNVGATGRAVIARVAEPGSTARAADIHDADAEGDGAGLFGSEVGGANVIEFAGEKGEAVAEIANAFEPGTDLEDSGAVGGSGCAG